MLSVPDIQESFGFSFETFKASHKYIASAKLSLNDKAVEERLIEEGGKVKFIPPVHVNGTPYDESCLNQVLVSYEGKVRPKRLVTLYNAAIVGWNAVLGADNLLYAPGKVSDNKMAAVIQTRTGSGHLGFSMRKFDEEWWIRFYKPVEGYSFPKRCLFIGALEPGNYGSFLFRVFSKLLMLPTIIDGYDCLILPDRSPWVMDVLKDMGVEIPVFIPKEVSGVKLDQVSFFPDDDDEGLLSVSDVNRIRSYSDSVSDYSSFPSCDKIYISRKLSHLVKPHFHPMLNEQEIEKYMKSLGFKIIYPETLGFKAQISLFKKVKVIVGPSGSGMLNAIFSDRGTVVIDLEGFSHCVRQHAKIYSSSDKTYSFCFGKVDDTDKVPPVLKKWTLEVPLLQKSLIQLQIIK